MLSVYVQINEFIRAWCFTDKYNARMDEYHMKLVNNYLNICERKGTTCAALEKTRMKLLYKSLVEQKYTVRIFVVGFS